MTSCVSTSLFTGILQEVRKNLRTYYTTSLLNSTHLKIHTLKLK